MSHAIETGHHPITGTARGPESGAARLALLAGALLSDIAALREATGDPNAESFYPNQVATFLCDDRFQAKEKSRQIGESWAMSADSLARASLEPASTNIHISTDKWESESKHNYVIRTYECFPKAYKQHIKIIADAKNHIEIETNKGRASIDFLAQRPPRGAERGGIYLHEMAHMAKMDAILKAGIFCTSRGGFIKGCSSHEGSDSLFNQIITDAADEETGERKYSFWTRGSFPWWTCPAFCVDIEQAMREAPTMETDDRVQRFGTQALKELRAGSSYDDFREECECLVIDSKYSYFPKELIESCQVALPPEGNYWFRKLEVTSRDTDVVNKAQQLIAELGKEIREGRLTGQWFWAMDIGVTSDPDAIVVGHTLREDQNTVALRLVITLENIDFPRKEEIVQYLIKNLPIERGLIDATGPGVQMGQWGEREFGQKAMPFIFTNASKSEIVNALKIRMERSDVFGSKRLMIPVWAKLQRQMHGIRKQVTPSGKAVYDSNREDKTHADIFWALAMMNSLAGMPSANYAFVPQVVNRSGSAQLPQRGQIWIPGRR
jgi:phage FluMu gp28-like protein